MKAVKKLATHGKIVSEEGKKAAAGACLEALKSEVGKGRHEPTLRRLCGILAALEAKVVEEHVPALRACVSARWCCNFLLASSGFSLTSDDLKVEAETEKDGLYKVKTLTSLGMRLEVLKMTQSEYESVRSLASPLVPTLEANDVLRAAEAGEVKAFLVAVCEGVEDDVETDDIFEGVDPTAYGEVIVLAHAAGRVLADKMGGEGKGGELGRGGGGGRGWMRRHADGILNSAEDERWDELRNLCFLV